MVATLNWIREDYGSIEKAVVDLNLITPEGIEQLRRNLIVDAKDEEPIEWQQHAKLLL